MTNIELIQTTTHLSQQTTEELKQLNQKLKPYLRQYDESKRAISFIYSEWLKTASKEAKTYAQPFLKELGISKGYISKLRTVNAFRELHSTEPDTFFTWFDSHGTFKQYQLAKANFNDVVVLWSIGETVSQKTLDDLKNKVHPLGKKPDKKKHTKADTSMDELLDMVKLQLVEGRSNEPSPLELRLRELIFHEIRLREEKKESIERQQEKRSYVGI
tara:strand:+ start:1271 stop:1918 length:648 start_codon:yes stop_codon:yes gene_type:complete